MPLPSQTLAALQLAGATIYQADLELKDAVQAYANQVRTAMTANPFEMRNDGLFEEWKAVARMSQAVAQIEVEFKKIYEMASGLTGAAALPNPTAAHFSGSPVCRRSGSETCQGHSGKRRGGQGTAGLQGEEITRWRRTKTIDREHRQVVCAPGRSHETECVREDRPSCGHR
jgi:hypothetical protein